MRPRRQALAYEGYVALLIHALCEAAHEARAFRAMRFWDWFVKEQGTEKSNVSDLIKKAGKTRGFQGRIAMIHPAHDKPSHPGHRRRG